MRYELRIGWRYLYGGRRGRALFSVFTSVSVLGVAIGVAALTIVLAVTTGFQKEFRDKVLGVNAHVIITQADLGFPGYRDVMATARALDRDVIGAEPFIFAEMLATRGKGELSGVAIKGVDPLLVREVLDLDKAMIEGSVDALGAAGPIPPILIGKELARKLRAKLGDTVTLVSPLSNLDLETGRTKGSPHTRAFRIAGIFYSGFEEYDRRLIYAALADTQALLPIEVRPVEVVIVAAITMAISVVATVVPARTASRLQPVDGLRYD